MTAVIVGAADDGLVDAEPELPGDDGLGGSAAA
jgi:hypothetical protein